VIATGSLRRQSQLLRHRPDLKLIEIRGNVETRLRKMEEQGLAGLMLAQAGLERLGLAHQIREILDPGWLLPAVGQGALGVECRSDDEATRALARQIDHRPTHLSVAAERTVLRELGGGCQVPIGVLSRLAGPMLWLRAVVLDPLGRECIEMERSDLIENAENLGRAVAGDLLALGASRLLGKCTGQER
jgi:hydroxymethylbilane synthase